ncbi:MAG: lipopolysaccharide heptosyltransferase II [Ignavibacteriales bacterium]|nr:lipopolysaccharide heptosyltransferase II [Ignavibacteriales bacterium]
MKIVVIQTAFPGDVILTLPLIQEAKKYFGETFIDVVVIPSCANILNNHPDGAEIITYDKKSGDAGIVGFLRLVSRLRKKNYDVALIPHRSLRSAMLAYFSFIPKRIGFDTSGGKSLYTNVIKYDRTIHEVERNLQLLSPFGYQHQKKIFPSLYPTDNDRQIVDVFISENKFSSDRKIISFAPGSVWNTKRWLKEHFVVLAKKITEENISIVLIGGKNDEHLCEEIQLSVSSKNIFNTAGKFSLLQSSEIIHRSQLLLCNDSAPMHLAVATKTPVVSIWGATVPEFGFAPYGENDVIIQTKGLSCRPCGIHGGNICPIGTFDCLEKISVEEVYAAIRRVLLRFPHQ